MNKIYVWVLIIVSLTSNVVLANTDARFAILNENVIKTKALAGLPSGTSIIAIKGDQIVYVGNFGFADIKQGVKVTEHTPFYIASVTKPFTALNALIDNHSGKLELNTKLIHMFPNMNFSSEHAAQVNIRHLMSHTSAIENLPLVLATAYSGVHDDASLNKIINVHSSQASHSLGEFKYTNVGYNLYSVFADRHFKAPWQSRLKQKILDPLGMKNTSASRHYFEERGIDVANPYSVFVPPLFSPLYLEKTDKTMHAAGGMFASSEDLAKFLVMQLNLGMLEGKQIFPKQVITKSQSKQVTTAKSYLDFEREGYAWGWYTGQYKGQKMLHHFGGFAGTHAHLSFMPEQKIGLVVLNNDDFLGSRLTSIIANHVYGTFLNEVEIEVQTAQRFKQLNQQVVQIPKRLAQQNQKVQARKLLLSKSIENYLGRYQHPLLGDLWVTKNNQSQLKLSWGQLKTIATGFDQVDVIRLTFDPTSGEVVRFGMDETGNVIKHLEYEGIKFIKIE